MVMQLTVEIVAGSEDCFYLPDLNISQTLEIEFQVTCVSTCFSTVSLFSNLLHAVSLFNTSSTLFLFLATSSTPCFSL